MGEGVGRSNDRRTLRLSVTMTSGTRKASVAAKATHSAPDSLPTASSLVAIALRTEKDGSFARFLTVSGSSASSTPAAVARRRASGWYASRLTNRLSGSEKLAEQMSQKTSATKAAETGRRSLSSVAPPSAFRRKEASAMPQEARCVAVEIRRAWTSRGEI